jgi:hypothetical protein
MPFIGIGIHVFIALLCAIHAVKTGQQLYWLFILFSFPLLGSLVYVLVIYLPNSKVERKAMKAMSVAAKALDPQKELRESRANFTETPTAQNQMRLAKALLDAGFPKESAEAYELCLEGPFSSDLDIRFGAAQAHDENSNFEAALKHASLIRQTKREYRPENIAILIAKCFSGLGRAGEAKVEYEEAEKQFGTFEVKGEFLIWGYESGTASVVNRLEPELDQLMSRWKRHTLDLNSSLIRRMKSSKSKYSASSQ